MKNQISFIVILLSLSFNTFSMVTISNNTFGMEKITKQLTDVQLHGWRFDKEYYYLPVTSAYRDITKKFVTSHTDDCKAIIHDAATMKEIISIPHPKWVWATSFHPTGKYLATGSIDGYICIFDIDQRKKIALLHCDGDIREVGFDKNGRLLARTHAGRTFAYVNDDKSIEQQFLKDLIDEFPTNTQKIGSPEALLTALASTFNLDENQLDTVWNTLSEDTQKFLFAIQQAKNRQ